MNLLLKNIFLGRFSVIILAVLFLIQTASSQTVKPEISSALEAGDTVRAIDLINTEISFDKGYYHNYYLLGSIYYEQGEFTKARDWLELAVKYKKKDARSQYLLGKTYLKLGDLESAEKVMSTYRKKAKKDDRHLFENGFGLVMLARENYQDADRAFRQAIVSRPNISEYHINLGDANFYSGVPYLAITEYKKALELDTAGLEVYYHWAEACLEMKDYNCAIEKLKVVLSKDSTYANAWMRAGGIYFRAALSTRQPAERKSRFLETIKSYDTYLELSGALPDSANVRAYLELALSYVNMFAFEDATEYFDKVLNIPYEPRDIYFYYGKALWGSKKFVEASEMLENHIEWVSKQDENYESQIRDGELYRLLGDSYYYRSNKEYLQAATHYKKSLEQAPGQKRLLMNVAVSYHQLKSYVQAIEYYNKRIELGIDSTSAAIYKNAGYCALNIANNESDGDEDDMMEEEEMEEEIVPASSVETVDYMAVALDFMGKYLEYKPKDVKVLILVANAYLYQLNECANGVAAYEKILAVESDNCDAKKAIGYAYFGGICSKNYTKSLKYLKGAYSCITSDGESCSDEDIILWIAQCYHLRAAEKQMAKKDSNNDFKNAYEWYGKVLKCDPGNSAAKKGQTDTRFEFFDKTDG